MRKKNIYDFLITDVSIFFYEMPSVQAESVIGGNTVVDLSTVHDGINNISTTSPRLVGIDDNKLFTFDFSRLTINWVIVLSETEAMLLRWLM